MMFPFRLLAEQTEGVQDGGAGVPRHHAASGRDVLAKLRADWHKPFGRHFELREKRAVFLFDRLEHILPVAHEVHLIDDHGNLPHAEQR